MKKQVKVFKNHECDTEVEVNRFLSNIDSNLIISVTPLHNTIIGGVDFVIVYQNVSETKNPF